MSKNRTPAWVVLTLVAVGLLLVAVPGLWMYTRATTKPLHPNPQSVPRVTHFPPSQQWADAVQQARQVVRSSLTEQNLPGLSVAVGVRGDIVWAEGFGFADLENRIEMTPAHRLRIGTASKVLTSAAAGLLLETGRLKLDDTIQTYVPEFPQKQWPVTVRHLMAHLGGVRTDSGDEGPLFSEHCARPVEALPHFADSSLMFEPGSQYRYSSYGWILVSAAIEAAANKPFLTFMR
ncbi:MAG TPA: serine hydrolase domain-containing protein, partial [Bryobacteraceae bacterium]|nr:serine hydrolase domain-containing protein [Bryobacteraceae bacterium]